MLSIYAVLINGVGIFTNLAFGRLAEVRLGWAMALGGGLCGLGLMLFLRGTRHGRGGVQPPPCVAPEKFCVR